MRGWVRTCVPVSMVGTLADLLRCSPLIMSDECRNIDRSKAGNYYVCTVIFGGALDKTIIVDGYIIIIIRYIMQYQQTLA